MERRRKISEKKFKNLITSLKIVLHLLRFTFLSFFSFPIFLLLSCMYLHSCLKVFLLLVFFSFFISLSLLYAGEFIKEIENCLLVKIEIDKAEIWSHFFPPFFMTSCLIHFTKLRLLWIIIWNIISVMW